MLKEQKEYTRAYLIKGACEGLFKGREVAERLKISLGRVDQLKRRYRKVGDMAFVHGNKGRVPANKIPESDRKMIVETKLTDVFVKANFTHYSEILEEMGMTYSYSAIRNILQGAGHKSPKSRRPKKLKQAHPPRPRRECFGEMLQADSSPFDWIGTGENSALHGFIDDATSSITGLYLEKNECLLGYLEVVRQTIERFGIPSELYPDKASVFFTTTQKENGTLTDKEHLDGLMARKTQLGLIMDELGVDMHPAHSPQAKGRIERLWETLQSRLPVEFRRHGISTMAAANRFLLKYIPVYNKEFAVGPADNHSHFVRLYDMSVLDSLLVCRIPRKTDGSGVFQFHNHKFIVPDPACRGKKIELVMSEKIGFKAMLHRRGKLYEIRYCDYFDNKHIKSHMPDVTKNFIHRYLKSSAKETARKELFYNALSWN